MIRTLVSVRDVEEAVAAARAGADYIDLKEPANGALGGIEPGRIAEIVAALRARFTAITVSATIGDHPTSERALILERVAAVAACGVDLVKVGVAGQGGAAERALLEALRRAPCRVVPVLIADDGVDTRFLATACTADFAAVMLDTQRKNAGSLVAQLGLPRLATLRDLAARHDCPLGLAGALRLDDLPAIAELAPDFAGFRTAVCSGDRTAQLDPRRVRHLREELRRLTALMA